MSTNDVFTVEREVLAPPIDLPDILKPKLWSLLLVQLRKRITLEHISVK